MLAPDHPSLDNEISVMDLPKITDPRGNLTFIEGNRHVPFDVQRVYYLYDVPSGGMRAGHAHHELQQIIIAVSGSFDLVLDNGFERRVLTCNRPSSGVLIRSLVWRELNNFSSGAVCLVLASKLYDENDYIRDYQTFLRETSKRSSR
ncbi:sugar 3,4-ketoisomerase [Caballeronia telluris]|uniref:TDP-4-oxo-6-deoxy-alpha-D-glucose-3, 4-oxoisomerase n=1 Tax=Caballeronia telluris TaxID=326475 RepID=A0A158IZA3_9BURK|nr:FdtA/QdtA family cupin domain-containing protein [Caballeronia telluris]SAL61449.1 TDP-4-oxo-6-deoxy-alpha-D-glucose-3, 4-oxoisomerase [Caballeronia telluris]